MTTELSASRSRSRPSAPACRSRTRPTPRSGRSRPRASSLKGEVENLSIDSLWPPDARPDRDARSTRPTRRSSGRWSAGPTARSTRAAATKVRSTASTPAAKARSSSTAKSSKSTRWRLLPAAASTSGTSPDGKIYKIDAAGKAPCSSIRADRYIWSLAVDKAGNVFAATGDKGVIYKITPDGKGRRLLPDQGDARDVAGVRRRRPSARRH